MNDNASNESNTIWPDAAPEGQFVSACTQTHSAMQWLARMVHSYCVPASDGSHLHLDWLGSDCTFRTRTIATDTLVELRLPELELQFVENGTPTKHVVELDDKSPAEIEAWTLIELLHRGIDRDKYSKNLPYDVSSLLSGDARHYETLDQTAGFRELADWLCLAVEVMAKACASTDCGPFKLDPDSFNLFTRINRDNSRPAAGNFIEVGFSAGQTETDSACFYVKCMPALDSRQQPDLPAPAVWHGDPGTKAVLAIDALRTGKIETSTLIEFFTPGAWLGATAD